MIPLVIRPSFLFAIAVATITLVAVALAQLFLMVALAVADLLCELGHTLFHGPHACHERAAFFLSSLDGW